MMKPIYALVALIGVVYLAGTVYATSGARGIRNNNPGNIKKTNDRWLGLARVQDDETFFIFENKYYGIRALMKLLINYKKLHGLTTVNEVINRYAPTSENDTHDYLISVFQYTSIPSNKEIDLENKEILFKLTKAIINHENGKQPYSQADFESAYSLI